MDLDNLEFKTLLTDGDNNPKTAKSNKASNYYTMIMHLAHANTAGFGTVCPWASQGCIDTCLDETGHGNMPMVKKVRAARTQFYLQHRDAFKTMLVSEIEKLVKKAKRLNKLPALRLNGTSDIVWEKIFPELFTHFPQVQFYDYTKAAKRCMKSWKLPDNYHLTFSRSETNEDDCRKVLKSGKCNIAAVWADANFPEKYMGKNVYSMDDTDLRFLDPPGVGGLYHKGGKKKLLEGLKNGFILPTTTKGVDNV